MNTSEYSKVESKQSYKCLRNFLNGNNKKEFSIKIPMLDVEGELEGYCIQKYDKWGHLIEETYFDFKSEFLMKVLITNDLTGYPLRKDYFNSHGQRIPNDYLQLKVC